MAENDKIEHLLGRNVAETINRSRLEKRLKNGEKLRVKFGVDPTGPKLHLGRAVALRKLKEFQELGHQIVLIIGDFTGLVGDASDKQSSRPILTKEQLSDNMKGYKDQIGKILEIKKIEFRHNSEWFDKLKLEELIKLASLFTVHQLVERRNFKERFEGGKTIGFHEFFYPLMQGYDSVMVKSDIEVGGTDQLFNFMAGRKIQEFYGQEPQDIMTLDMMMGLDGKKMSTSQGNVINIVEEADNMFGQVMSMKDELMADYFILATDLPAEKIKNIDRQLEEEKVNPADIKKELAFEIVKIYHGEKKAKEAKEKFIRVFQNKELPEEAVVVKAELGGELKGLLLANDFISSSASFRRLVKEGAVDFNGEMVEDVHYKIEKPGIVRVGKKKFVKIRF